MAYGVLGRRVLTTALPVEASLRKGVEIEDGNDRLVVVAVNRCGTNDRLFDNLA